MLSTTRNLMWLLFAGKTIRWWQLLQHFMEKNQWKENVVISKTKVAESRLINQIQFLSTTKLWVELTKWTKTLAHIWSTFTTRRVVASFSILCRPSCKQCFQLYCLQPLNQGQKRLDILGFRREIIQVYHARFRSEKTLPVIFPKKHPKSQSRHPLWRNWPLDCQRKSTAMCQMFKNEQIFLWKVQCWSSSLLF